MQANSSEPYPSSWRESNEFCYCLFTSFTENVKLGIFTGSRAVDGKEMYIKNVMHVQSRCFALSSYYLFEFLIAAAY